MAHMRNKAVTCPSCKMLCRFTANLDTGRLTEALMPAQCSTPVKCARVLVDGIFSRRFGERIERMPETAKT